LELAEIFGRIESSRAEEIRSIDSWTREEAEEMLRTTNRHEPRYYPLILTLLHP
jgi:hypothetical protein